MRIGVFGATGVIGERVVAEAAARDHLVTAFTRNRARFAPEREHVRWAVANPLDTGSVSAALHGLDVVVNAINTGATIDETIDNADDLPAAATALLAALDRGHPRTRLIVVGGAGSLEIAPGLQVADVDGFGDRLPDTLGVPREYEKVVRAHREALNLYRLSNRNWTYLSPSAARIEPGPRTGRFRTGTNQLLTAEDGTADISAEDLAVAILDEIELPRHVQRRFTVGY